MLRESCFYRKLTDTSKDEENHEESEALQEDMLGLGILILRSCLFIPLLMKEENIKICYLLHYRKQVVTSNTNSKTGIKGCGRKCWPYCV